MPRTFSFNPDFPLRGLWGYHTNDINGLGFVFLNGTTCPRNQDQAIVNDDINSVVSNDNEDTGNT